MKIHAVFGGLIGLAGMATVVVGNWLVMRTSKA